MAKYKTISGDTWDSIAYKTMGSGYLMDKLIQANKKYCETFIFQAGIELEIPEVEVEQSSTNPPWFTQG
jgi:phage tail protein X